MGTVLDETNMIEKTTILLRVVRPSQVVKGVQRVFLSVARIPYACTYTRTNPVRLYSSYTSSLYSSTAGGEVPRAEPRHPIEQCSLNGWRGSARGLLPYGASPFRARVMNPVTRWLHAYPGVRSRARPCSFTLALPPCTTHLRLCCLRSARQAAEGFGRDNVPSGHANQDGHAVAVAENLHGAEAAHRRFSCRGSSTRPTWWSAPPRCAVPVRGS